jgi:hypothetical protein
MSGIGGLHRIARKLGDDASACRRQAEAARDEASGAGEGKGQCDFVLASAQSSSGKLAVRARLAVTPRSVLECRVKTKVS